MANMIVVKEQLIGQIDRFGNMPDHLKVALTKLYPSELAGLVNWINDDRALERENNR